MLFFEVAHAAWRIVLFLGLGIAPYAAPVDSARVDSTGIAVVRLALFAAIATTFALIIRVGGRTNRPLALLASVTLAAAIILPSVFSRDAGPLARGTPLIVPLVWGTLAALAANLPFPALRRRSLRIAAIGIVAAGGIVSFAAAKGRFAPARMARAAITLDPGNEAAALLVAHEKLDAGEKRAAYDILARCASARPSACGCADLAVETALDLGLYGEAKSTLDVASACERTAHRVALDAEVLVGNGATEEGMRKAEAALVLEPGEPHAAYAKAWGLFVMGDIVKARGVAESPTALARGVPAHLLLGLILFRANDVATATKEFQAALQLDPANSQATYDLALLAHRENRFHDAREGYLRALRLDPTFADARYRLAILTMEHGAMGEAEHHIETFAATFPEDARVDQLRRLLSERAAADRPH